MSLDGEQIQNKMVTTPPAKKSFIFPGDGIWHPERIDAETREAAEAIYHTIKRLIVPDDSVTAAPLSTPQTPPKEESVQ